MSFLKEQLQNPNIKDNLMLSRNAENLDNSFENEQTTREILSKFNKFQHQVETIISNG